VTLNEDFAMRCSQLLGTATFILKAKATTQTLLMILAATSSRKSQGKTNSSQI
jgi:hypothetical protein